MGNRAGARDLRTLLSVAKKLRHLAKDTLCQGDKVLYLMAAEALEKRASWLSVALPAPSETSQTEDPRLHQPVDMRV